MGRLKAMLLLSWALILTLLRGWFFRRPGLPAFRAHYAADRILPLSLAEQRELVEFSRCVACGLCDDGEAERIAASRGEYPGLMTLALSSLRSTTEIAAAGRAFSHVPASVLDLKEAICPMRVPFGRMKRFVESKAQELAQLEGEAET